MDHPRPTLRRARLRAAAVLGRASSLITSLGGVAQAAEGDDLAPLRLADTAAAIDGRHVVVLDEAATTRA